MRCLGEKNPEVASTLNNIGYTMDAMKNYSEAIKYYNKSLAIRLEIFGNTHPLISVTYYNLGSAYESLGDKNSALSAYKNALKSLPDGHPNIKKINDTIDRIEKGTN
jgi:tetratricopeptide (TPR) repeat protein